MTMPEAAEAVLAFWFGTPPGASRPEWFRKDPAFDEAIGSRFGALLEEASAGGLVTWEAEPASALALVVVLDQFSRNLHRGRARDELVLLQPLRFFVRGQALGADRHIYAPRSRFIGEADIALQDARPSQRCCEHLQWSIRKRRHLFTVAGAVQVLAWPHLIPVSPRSLESMEAPHRVAGF